MAKLSETQRAYFINRVSTQIQDKINVIRHKNSAKIAKMSITSYKKYTKEIGVDKLLSRLRKIQEEKDSLKNLLDTTVRNIKGSSYSNCYNVNDFEKFFKEEARKIVNNQFENTKDGKDILKLQTLRDKATDYLYGLNSNREITEGLNAILNPSGIKLITK
tara:strand:+ start:2595 stop:3077 length:483 start_codon:yes stop_codon:yes gene_type:complete